MEHEKSIKELLTPALRVLKELNGSIVFSDGEGEQYVIMKRSDVEGKREGDRQLSLPTAETVSRAIKKNIPADVDDEVLERINRDIALSQVQERGETEDDISLSYERGRKESAFNGPKPPPVRVKFEPIRGDLPPELQE